MAAQGQPVPERLVTGRLVLTPLEPTDAPTMATVLSDPALYAHTGGSPPSMQELQRRYRRQTGGPWPPGETWLNWVVRLADGVPIGYVQVTIAAQAADLAWVVATDHQGHGYASEAARAVTGWLMSHGICTLTAHIPLAHPASAAVAAAVGLQPSGTFDETGEQIWVLENDAST